MSPDGVGFEAPPAIAYRMWYDGAVWRNFLDVTWRRAETRNEPIATKTGIVKRKIDKDVN